MHIGRQPCKIIEYKRIRFKLSGLLYTHKYSTLYCHVYLLIFKCLPLVASQTWLPLTPFSSFFLFLFLLVPSILPTSPFLLSFTQKFTHLLDDTRQKIKWIRIEIFQIFPRNESQPTTLPSFSIVSSPKRERNIIRNKYFPIPFPSSQDLQTLLNLYNF